MQLADGTRLLVRSLGPADGDLLERFFYRLSARSVYRRFMSPLSRPTLSMARRLLAVDHCATEALAALHEGEIVGVARYARGPQGDHDIAVVVADSWQRRGVSRGLLTLLARVARLRGIDRFHALMLAENRPAIEMLRQIFPSTRFHPDGTEVEAEIPLRAGVP